MACALAKGPVGRPALAPRCLTRNQALCPSGRPLRGGHSHHGAQSPGSLTPAFPSIGMSDTPSSLRAQMESFQISACPQVPAAAPTPPGIPPTAPGFVPVLGTHHSASPLLLPPHLLLSQPRSHACHAPILCSISEWAFGVCTPKPAPDLSLLGGSKDSMRALDSRASA